VRKRNYCVKVRGNYKTLGRKSAAEEKQDKVW